MNILITGANGFIGSELSKLLSVSHSVTALNGRTDIDLTKHSQVEKLFDNEYDLVIHCATAGRYNHQTTSKSLLSANMKMFANIYVHRSKFKKLINIGSGAEFDLDQNIENIHEHELLSRLPKSSYGLSKNFISRTVMKTDNFYTLRLFGCLSDTPVTGTLMRNFLNSKNIFNVENDRFFDFFSVKDLCAVIEYVATHDIEEKDINLVYDQKLKISDLLNRYYKLHNIDKTVNVVSTSQNNYTGSNSRLNKLNIKLTGLDSVLQDCK